MKHLSGCNVCAPVIAEQIERFEFSPPPLSQNKGHYLFRDDELIDYVCPNCSSRARVRTFAAVMLSSRPFRLNDRHALLVSAGKQERAIVANSGYAITHVSLQGDHGDPSCRIGTDIANMPEIGDAEFDLVLAVNVLDYIPDLDKVFGEIRRVLTPCGWFMFFIQPHRLVSGEAPPRIRHLNALAHEKYAAKEGQTGVPDCEFSLGWIEQTAKIRGLRILPTPIYDPLTRLPFTWFFAQIQR